MDSHRQRLYRTSAIVLKRQDFGEADRILTLLTPEHGKLRVIAKGVRRPASRKSGHVEPFTYSRLLVAKGRNLDIVTQAETIQSFRKLREDLPRITYAYYIAELVDQFTQDHDENRLLFDLLLNTLRALGEADNLRLTARFFELRLLDCVGYRPALFRCVHCSREIEPVDNFFSLESGGVVCGDCAAGPSGEQVLREGTSGYGEVPKAMQPLSLNGLKVLRFLQTQNYATCRHLRVRGETHAELERLMHRYLTYLLERELKSVEFLETLRRQASVLQLRVV